MWGSLGTDVFGHFWDISPKSSQMRAKTILMERPCDDLDLMFCFNLEQNEREYHNRGTCAEMELAYQVTACWKMGILVTSGPRLRSPESLESFPPSRPCESGPPLCLAGSRHSLSCFGSRPPSNTRELITVSRAVERNTHWLPSKVSYAAGTVSAFSTLWAGREGGNLALSHTHTLGNTHTHTGGKSPCSASLSKQNI